MSATLSSDLEELKNHPRVLELYLARARFTKVGNEYEACCPFHRENTPSCKLFHRDGRWLWHCFGCGKGGSIIDFIMERGW